MLQPEVFHVAMISSSLRIRQYFLSWAHPGQVAAWVLWDQLFGRAGLVSQRVAGLRVTFVPGTVVSTCAFSPSPHDPCEAGSMIPSGPTGRGYTRTKVLSRVVKALIPRDASRVWALVYFAPRRTCISCEGLQDGAHISLSCIDCWKNTASGDSLGTLPPGTRGSGCHTWAPLGLVILEVFPSPSVELQSTGNPPI